MTMKVKKSLLVLGTTILVMQAVFMPIGMVYAETTMDTEEQEQVELPPMKNYLEEEQASDPRFFFTRSRMQATVEEVTKITFFSDQEIFETTVVLPNEATVIKDQLPTGLSLEQTDQKNEWVIKATRAQNTFVLPVVFDAMGSYAVSVEEATAQIDVAEKEETEAAEDSFDEQENANEIDEELESEEIEAEEEETPEEKKEESFSPEVEDPKDQPAKEEMMEEEHETIERAVFDGDVAEVSTMAQFREAVADPEIGIISVQANLSENAANILRVDRPLLIQGNGYTLTFGSNGFYFQLEDVEEDSTLRIENATLTKVGTTPLLNSSVTASSKWMVELETIREVNANTMRLAVVPEGTIVFTGGVSNFTRTASTTVFIQAKEVQAINQAQVTISRGNATIFSSPATVSNPKLIVDDGAMITITTAAGTANTIDFRGENSEIMLLGAGELTVNTIGPATAATPTDTLNNTIALTGQSPKLEISGESRLSVQSTLSKRGIHLAGSNPQVLVESSELTAVSATQATLNLAGENPRFSAENSTLQLRSTTGQRMNLIGSNPFLNLKNSQLDMNATAGRGIYLQGATPQVLMDDSQLLMSDTGASQGMILAGTDALLSLSNQSELAITGAGTGALENIQIGNNNARPELLVTGESKVSVTTTSGTAAATDTSNNALAIRGLSPKVNVLEESEICIDIASGMRRGLSVVGNTANINFEDSKLDIQSAGSAYYMNSESPSFSAIGKGTEISLSSLSEDTFNSTSPTSHYSGSRDGGDFLISDGAVVNVVNEGGFHGFVMYTRAPSLEIIKGAKFYIRGNGDVGKAALRFLSSGTFLVDNAHVSIDKPSGTAPAVRFYTYQAVGISPEFVVRNGGKINIHSVGSGSPIGSGVAGANQALYFTGSSNLTLKSYFRVDGRGSEINFSAENGPAIDFVNFPGEFHVSNFGSIIASGRTPLANQGAIVGGMMNVTFDNPLFMDFQNTRIGGGNIFAVSNGSKLTATDSDLAVWRNGANLDGDPDLNFRTLSYSFTGVNFNTLESTSDPEQLNTAVLGTSGLTAYSRMSSNNGRWAITDELRVPTNADKKIHGRVSLPVGLDDSRPAWDEEAIVTVEVESPSGETIQEYTTKTVGDTNESPGISIYGEESRGGLFEIDLDEPLEAGSKVRISKVELTSGELTDGFEHQILTDTVEVFPIIPPRPAQFSSLIIAQDSTTIQGMTDNLDAEVTATHNGEPFNTEAVTVDADGRFTLDLSEVSLEMDDEIQVFLRDVKGSALAAGVVNPPETNNARGNINPTAELTFHDVTFEPATTLIVGDLGPVSPVDPLDPEIEVDPENKPELPEDQGQLSIDFVSSFDFGSQAISVHDQTYYAKLQRLLNEDGTVNDSEERPNYVQISDRRSENDRNGWTLAVTQKEQFKGAENQVLNGASLSLSNQQVITTQGGTAPGLQSVPCTLVPGNRRTLLHAQGSEGTGTWIYRFGDGETAGESVALDVPKGANPEATTYSSTLIWELSAVPGN